MAKKLKNPEMLKAEILTLRSKINSLSTNYKALELKADRIKQSAAETKAKAGKLSTRLRELESKASANGIHV